MKTTLTRILLVIAALSLLLTTMSCETTTYVGVGVGVAGPYHGYPYGRYGYPYGGTVWVGRPF